MSLDWAMLDNNQPIPLPEEEFILSLPGAEFTLMVPSAPPTGEASAGGSGGAGTKTVAAGMVWVSDQRVIFVPSTSIKQAQPYKSVSIPLPSIVSTAFAQPVFGSNHLDMTIHPSPGGGLTEGTKAEVRFADRGVFQFAKVLEAARERAIYKQQEKAAAGGSEALPMYDAPPPEVGSSSAAGTSTAAVVPPHDPGLIPEDAPPGYEL